jgi:hypothetical protein
MIQVCSQCGTRWNVRDRQRSWCPRCNGALLAPSGYAAGTEWRPTASPLGPSADRTPPRLPSGYRWIAVRPGAAPPPHRRHRALGPTPRYATVPRWGLVETFETPDEQQSAARSGPTGAVLRAVVLATLAVLGVAALVHVVRYILMLINRAVLLPPLVAGAATWLGVLVSVAAVFMVVATAVVLSNWLIARRAAAYAHLGQPDPRSVRTLRLGTLVPLVNLVLAPVYLLELATVENKINHLRRPIVVWWIMWALSYAVSIASVATSFAGDAQGIADNTVTTTVAYLLALAALLTVFGVYLGFERAPVARPVRRWVVVPDDTDGDAPVRADDEAPDADAKRDSAVPVESEGQNPAA